MVNQGTARATQVDGGIGLDIALVGRQLQTEAAHSRDDALGYRVTKAVRVADSQHHITHGDILGIRQRNRCQRRQVDMQNGEIGLGVTAHHRGTGRTAVRKQYLNGVSACNHVVVGHNMSRGTENHARAQRALDALATAAIGKQATLQR